MLVRMHDIEAGHSNLQEHKYGEEVHAEGHVSHELGLWVILRLLLLLLGRIRDHSNLLSLNFLPLILQTLSLRKLSHFNLRLFFWLLQMSVDITDSCLDN